MMIKLFFWPFMILSILTSIYGLIRRKSGYLYLAAFFIVPLSLYLAATPIFYIWGLLFPLLYLGAGGLIKKRYYRIAVLLALPVYILIGWIGLTVMLA